MEQPLFPVKPNLERNFYPVSFRMVRRVPAGVFVTLLILLAGLSAAAGYLINGGAEARANQPATFAAASSSNTPEAGFGTTGENSTRRHTISLGAYVLKRNFEDEKALAEKLDQPFHIVISEKRVTLTRLFLGTYPKGESAAVLARMREISPAAFIVHYSQDELVSAYGGSFYYDADAEKQRALFALHGVQATKVPARTTLPMYTACMGDFENRTAAVEFLRTAGLSENDTAVMPIL